MPRYRNSDAGCTSWGGYVMGIKGGAAIVTNTTGNQLTSYAAGTAYALTATPAQVVFGTTSPALTINGPGTYLILANAKIDYAGATFAAVRTPTLKLRRTNNTAADLTNGSVTSSTAIITALTFSFINQAWWTIYTTTNSDDIIQLFGSIDAIPTAGALNVSAASLLAFRIQQ